MADNAYQFQADLAKFAEVTKISLQNVVRRVAFQLYTEITKGWPVDTGYSRANWRLSVGEPDVSVLPPPDPGDRGKGKQIYPMPDPDARELASIDGKEPVFITNNVDYAIYLEEGHSKQAPSGVVRISLNRVEAQMNDIIASASQGGSETA